MRYRPPCEEAWASALLASRKRVRALAGTCRRAMNIVRATRGAPLRNRSQQMRPGAGSIIRAGRPNERFEDQSLSGAIETQIPGAL